MSSTENLINVGKHSNGVSGSGYSSDIEYENNNYHNTLSRNKPRGRERLERTNGFENRGFEEDVNAKQTIHVNEHDTSGSTRTQQGSLRDAQVAAAELRGISPYYRTNTTNSAPVYSRVNKSVKSSSSNKQRTRSSATEQNLHRKAVLNNIKLRKSKSTSYLALSESLEDDVFYPAENAGDLNPGRQVNKQIKSSNKRGFAASRENNLSQVNDSSLHDYIERITQVVKERARLAEKLRLLRKNVEDRNNGWTAGAETWIGSQSNRLEDVRRPGLLPNPPQQSEVEHISTDANKNNPQIMKTQHRQEPRQSDLRLPDVRPISQFSTKNRYPEVITQNSSHSWPQLPFNNSNSRHDQDVSSDEIGRRQTIKSIADDLWERLSSGEEFYTPDSGKRKSGQLSNRGASSVKKSTVHSDNGDQSPHESRGITFQRNRSELGGEKREKSIDKTIEEFMAFEKQYYEDQEKTEQQKHSQQRESAQKTLTTSPLYKNRQRIPEFVKNPEVADCIDSINEGQTINGKELRRCSKEERTSVQNSPFFPRKTNNHGITDTTTSESGSEQDQKTFKNFNTGKASKTDQRNDTPNTTPRGQNLNYMPLPPMIMPGDHFSVNSKNPGSLDSNPPVEIIYDSTAEQAEPYHGNMSIDRERNQRQPDKLGSKAAQKLRYYRSRSQTLFSSEQTEGPVTRDLSAMYITASDPEVRREIQRQAAGEAAILRREASHLLWHAMNLERVCDPNARVRHVYMQHLYYKGYSIYPMP